MAITGDQLRMARAALKLTVRDLAEITGIDKSTIARAEAGGRAYYATMVKLQEALESNGVEFLDPTDERGAGVALKLGVDPSRKSDEKGTALDKQEHGGLQALDPVLAKFWTERPDVFARLSEEGRRAISEVALGDPEALDGLTAS
ncbi:helix-turn-helix domain-containing protein [Rhodomicrobium lacus]|uniref:helix-turn-helix domain-containing protein n=1 Tax=Rhodomicrobium lacus TaxID=2498452 RepID=UPI0026E2CA62|nr:helix-turn-helix transcriptional regulator [Rhodomicrobium lacus]WKW51400.1 helix-turn-helix transcriptional regulator [Rhodomicrobium lacus]